MARPPKQIKHKVDTKTGYILVAYMESPDHYHQSPEKELDRALAWAKRNKNRLLAEPDQPLLMRELAKGFFEESGDWYQDRLKKGRGMTRASLALRQAHIDNYIIPLFGEYDIRAILGADINQRIRDAERLSTRRGLKTAAARHPLTRSTRSKILYSIKLMYDHWISLGIVKENPTDGIVKYSKEPERPRGALPREVLEQLFPVGHGALVRVWGSTMWAALMLVLYDTGTRSGEPRAKKWKDYYPELNFFPIREAIESGTAATIKATKTGYAKPAYLQDRTVQELAIWRAESRHGNDDDFMFTLNGEAPVSNAAIGQVFKRALERLGYNATGWTPYWLRHTFVTRKLEILSEEDVAMLAGHSVQISRSNYQHPDDETLFRKSMDVHNKLAKAWLHEHDSEVEDL